jgi:hypothetical protein
MLTLAANRPTYLMKRGIEVQLFSPERRTRACDEFVIGFVGRLSPEKSVRMLADVERACASTALPTIVSWSLATVRNVPG